MSNQIEMIQKLYAKTKTYKIPKKPKEGEEQLSIEITPLTLEDIGLLDMDEEMPLSEKIEKMKAIFSKSLGIEKKDTEKIAFRFMNEILDAIKDANDLKDEDLKKTVIKDFIKKKQEQIKVKKEEEDAKSNRPS